MTAPISQRYCTAEDIQLGDLEPPRSISVDDVIQSTADHMNSYIGQVYVLPLVLEMDRPDHLADILLLRRINSWLTMGQIIMLAHSGGEGDNNHAYGKWMWDAAQQELTRISAGRTVLEVADLRDPPNPQPNGPLISNRDETSFVDAFYRSKGTAHLGYDAWGVGSG